MVETRSGVRAVQRPLSPHLQIWRFSWTMAMSIFHRATGIALYLGAFVLAWWLIALAAGADAYAVFRVVATSWVGIAALIGLSWALIHHTLGGIRHFAQDALYGLDPAPRRLWAVGTLIGSLVLTLLLWVTIFALPG